MLVRALAALTVVGFAVPNAMVATFLITNGPSLTDYFAAWVASLPSTQVTVDLVLVSVTFAVWSAVDARRHSVRFRQPSLSASVSPFRCTC